MSAVPTVVCRLLLHYFIKRQKHTDVRHFKVTTPVKSKAADVKPISSCSADGPTPTSPADTRKFSPEIPDIPSVDCLPILSPPDEQIIVLNLDVTFFFDLIPGVVYT